VAVAICAGISPFIFITVSLMWMNRWGITWAVFMHYINDFLTVEKPGLEECWNNRDNLLY